MKLRTAILLTALLAFVPPGSFASDSPHELTLQWRIPDDILALTHGGQIPMRRYPSNQIPSLAGTGAESQLAVMLRVRDREGAIVGIASELETLPAPGEEKPTDVHWTVLLPGRGALYAHCLEVLRPEAAAVMAKVSETDEPWKGTLDVQATAGPTEDGKCEVRSGTGEFANATGTMIEIDRYRTMSTSDMTGVVELRFELHFDGSAR